MSIRTGGKRGWIWSLIVGSPVLAFILFADQPGLRDFNFGTMKVFVFGTVCTLAGILGIVHTRQLAKSLPFPPGRYLFATNFIEAPGPEVQFFDLSALTDLTATHEHTNGIYTGTDFALKFAQCTVFFSIKGKKKAEAMLADFNAHRRALLVAARAQDWPAVHALDPLFEGRMSPEWAGQGMTAPVLPRDAKAQARHISWPLASVGRVLLISIAAGCVLAPVMFLLGNLIHDDEAFARAKETNTPDAYRDYLAVGMLHTAEVKAELLPRAVFQQADNAGSVRLFREFLRGFGNHALAADARRSIHELYEKSLARALGQAAPSAHEFLRKLFAWLEEKDSPPLQVRFATPTLETLEKIDRALGGKLDDLPIAPVASSFTTDRCMARESGIVNGLSSGFRRVVPAEILTLSSGPGLRKEDTAFPQATVAIHYSVKPSGASYVDEKRTRAFVGIIVDFSLDLSVPSGGQPMRIAFTVEPPPRFTVHERRESFRPMASDATVYDTMAARAFDTLGQKLGETFFKKPKQ